MAFAAKSVGVESDKLTDILKDTTERFGEFAATGGGELKDFFDNVAPKVGLTAEAFKNLSGPDALQAYYNALSKAGLNQQQMTYYMEAMNAEGGGGDAEADPMYDQAVAVVLQNRKASISLVQRHLRIGYNRAARLLEQMEQSGLVSSMSTNGNRDLLVPARPTE